MQQLIIQEGLPVIERVTTNQTSEVDRVVSGLQRDTDRQLLDTHPAGEFHPVILRMDVPLAIQAALAIPEELAGLTAHLPEAEVSDLTVAVLEVADSREGEAKDFQEEAVGAFLAEGPRDIDELIPMIGMLGR